MPRFESHQRIQNQLFIPILASDSETRYGTDEYMYMYSTRQVRHYTDGTTLLFVQIQLMCGAVRIILLSVNASRDDLEPK